MPHLAFPLAGPLGADPASSVVPAAVTGHVAIALSQLIEQYRQSPNLQSFITAFANRTQERDDAEVQLKSLTSIDDSSGVQLDNLGAILNEPRQGFGDVTYRLHLKARVLLNRTSGTVEDILALFVQLLGTTPLTLTEGFPAGLTLQIDTLAVDGTLAPYLVKFLRAVKSGGVRAILEWSEHFPSETFTFAGGGGLGFDAGYWASAR